MRISDWSSDVCSSDLATLPLGGSALPMVRSTVYSTRVSQECPVMKSGLLASAGRPGNANTTYHTCLPRLRSKRLLLRSKPGGFVNRPTRSPQRNWDTTISKGDPGRDYTDIH